MSAEKIVAEVGRIVTNVSNWPDGVAAHMLGRDLTGPINKIAAALEPVIREREKKAWDAGFGSAQVWLFGKNEEPPTNPYGIKEEA